MAILWSQNSTHVQLPCTAANASGPIDLTGLTGANIAVKIRPDVPNSTYTTCAGTATITSPSAGQFTYKFAPADVASVGAFRLVVSITFPTNDPWNSFEQQFIISQAS